MDALDAQFLNCPKTLPKSALQRIRSMEKPAFERTLYMEDPLLAKLVKKYRTYRNFVVIANGGSRTGLYFLYNAFRLELKAQVLFVTSPDATRLNDIARRYKKKDTCVVVISKSGTNVVPLEGLLYFRKRGYTILAVTGETGTLREIAFRDRLDIVVHPSVGGRFSFFSSCAMFLASVWGLDTQEILRGARAAFKQFGPSNATAKNDALMTALVLHTLEKKGYTDICNGIYDGEYAASLPLLTQLMHESVCKDGKTGQSFFGDEGPEVQHHTMQRIFGGRRDVVLFMTHVQDEAHVKLSVPQRLADVPLRSGHVAIFDELDLASALSYELLGNLEHCKEAKIPCVLLTIKDISLRSLSAYVVYWFYVAVYSAVLRGVDPFDQPHVESAKNNTFDLLNRRR